ncbi:MAG: hypothetical protein KF862_14055 [Chitinophagaceae bacterium]|nr:hypothetical protein [Chitinophagaceae bacterium]
MENILQFYFHRSTLEEVDMREVEQLAVQYPYLRTAQYFLAKKYLQTNHPECKKQLAKTALFFNNPHWLSLLLHDQLFVKEAFEENVVSKVIAEQDIVADEAPLINEGNEPPVVAESIQEEQKETLPATDDEPAETALETPGEAAPETLPVIESGQENEVMEDAASAQADEEYREAQQPGEEEKFAVIEQVSFRLPFEKKGGQTNDLPAEGTIPIEPLYTIDYFASQGIKLREIEGKDKLSVKLRSFTEWLKTMKRIHPEKLENESEEQVQTKIQHIAEHSNEANEVLTEAMAEVFARQGLFQKAAEVYQKLSLQNPDKRAYFAAKISKLNDH